jgi:predicted TIM-barrel fold metal-dependent hydrolase
VNRFTEPVHETVHQGAATFPDPEMAIDVHQHLLPAQLIEALRERSVPPRLRGWELELNGEPAYAIDPRDHDVAVRSAEAAADGLQLALVSLSSALGVEELPPEEAGELIGAFHEGARELPPPFRPWAAACLSEIDPGALERALDEGCVGLQLPATRLLTASDYAYVAPLLEVLAARGRPLFIHPGPAGPDPESRPPWWPALVPYVQQMHAAWFAFRLHGRPAFPDLPVCMALLAGLAPLHAERLAARGGGRGAVDENVFLEVSSYGPRAIDATVRVLGVDVLVNGSDRPYASPASPELGDAFDAALRLTNPLRLLDLEEVIDAPEITAGAQS